MAAASFFQEFGERRHEADVDALARKPLRDRKADPLRAAGNQSRCGRESFKSMFKPLAFAALPCRFSRPLSIASRAAMV